MREQATKMLLPMLLCLFLIAYLSNRIIYNIMPGEAGVLWKRFAGGTAVDYVYPEGIHFIPPWDYMYIYNIRIQQTAHEFDVLTKNGLAIHLSISVRYYPEQKLLGVLHQKVGPDYVQTVVIPEIESVLRILIGKMRAEEVYTTERSIIEQSLNYAVEQIAQRYINVDNVIIKRIGFPAFIANAIEKKMEQQQLTEAYEFKLEGERKEAERKDIEAKGLKNYNEVLSPSLTDRLLQWRAIQATLELSKSANAKVVVIGSGKDGLPLVGNIPLEQPFRNLSSVAGNPQDAPAATSTPAAETNKPRAEAGRPAAVETPK